MGVLSHIATPLFLEWPRSPSGPYKNSSSVDFFEIFISVSILEHKGDTETGFY